MKTVREAVMLGIQPMAALPEARFVIPIVGRARIHAVLLTQKAGSADGFTFALNSQYAACPANYPTLDTAAPTSTDAPAIYDVLGTLSSSGANIIFRDSFGVPYNNHGNSIAGRTEEIYGKLVVSSPNDNKIFDLRILYSEAD